MDDMPFYADDHFVGIQTHFMKIVALYDNLINLIGNKNKSITKETFIHTIAQVQKCKHSPEAFKCLHWNFISIIKDERCCSNIWADTCISQAQMTLLIMLFINMSPQFDHLHTTIQGPLNGYWPLITYLSHSPNIPLPSPSPYHHVNSF